MRLWAVAFAPALAAMLALVAVACGDDDDDVTVAPAPTQQAAPPATESATPTPTATAPAGTPPTSTAAPPAAGACPAPGVADSDGTPFGSEQLRTAIEAGGWCFLSYPANSPCTATSVSGVMHFSARPNTDAGLTFVLWTYPDRASLQLDWRVGPGEPPAALTTDCDPGSGWVYWHENLVLAFVPCVPADLAPPDCAATNPSGHPAIEAFLSLAR